MTIDRRLRDASGRLRSALTELPVAEVPPDPARSPRGRAVVIVAAVVVVSVLVAGVATRVDDRDPATEHRTTDGGPSTAPEGAKTRVPDIVGSSLVEARTMLTQADLKLAVEEFDPPFAEAVVIAAEPGEGLEVPTGSVVGVRTVLPDPPLSVECPSPRHPRGDADADALPHVGQVARAGAEATVQSLRTQVPPESETEVYLGVWNRWAYEEREGAVVTEPTAGFQAVVITPSASDCAQTPTFELAPVTFVFGDPTDWAGARLDLDEGGESPAERIDAGPLSPRGGHSVVWTGNELIVWGGWGDEMGNTKRGDGAAYDPASNSWRMIAPSPLSPRRNHAAAWTGDEMVVFGGDGRRDGAAYDPESDTWRRLEDAPFGIGAYEVRDREESHLFADGGLFVWQAPTDRVARWDATSESWSTVDGTGLAQLTSGALRATSDRLYAVGTTAYTGVPLLIARANLRVSDGWTRLEDGTLSTSENVVPDADPQWSATVSDGRLVAWSIGLPDTAIELDPNTERWSDLPPHNVRSCEGAPGPVAMDNRLLVQSCGSSTVYNSTTDSWMQIDLADAAIEPSTAVWTGSELISWGDTCCYGTGGAAFEPNTAWIIRLP